MVPSPTMNPVNFGERGLTMPKLMPTSAENQIQDRKGYPVVILLDQLGISVLLRQLPEFVLGGRIIDLLILELAVDVCLQGKDILIEGEVAVHGFRAHEHAAVFQLHHDGTGV